MSFLLIISGCIGLKSGPEEEMDDEDELYIIDVGFGKVVDSGSIFSAVVTKSAWPVVTSGICLLLGGMALTKLVTELGDN